ncbi:hypothetical protein [Deinococcus humi]|uniref:Uncharacterized protein n=1 Tax=Deinococcus humi TaxID=662880 RepID=A0A7W8JTY8_9DEIO|nr:hypothetical protein [Deinococcus humi]MBB5363202.1 hypothetical protein [Deinococcus humi]
MKKMMKMVLSTAVAGLLTSALATAVVSESNLTGLKLPKGAIEVTDQKAIADMAEYIEEVAGGMGGTCEYSEFLVWLDSDPDAIADALGQTIVAAKFKIEDIDAGEISKGSTYEEFSMVSSKEKYAAVWVDSPDSVVLGWCNVVK